MSVETEPITTQEIKVSSEKYKSLFDEIEMNSISKIDDPSTHAFAFNFLKFLEAEKQNKPLTFSNPQAFLLNNEMIFNFSQEEGVISTKDEVFTSYKQLKKHYSPSEYMPPHQVENIFMSGFEDIFTRIQNGCYPEDGKIPAQNNILSTYVRTIGKFALDGMSKVDAGASRISIFSGALQDLNNQYGRTARRLDIQPKNEEQRKLLRQVEDQLFLIKTLEELLTFYSDGSVKNFTKLIDYFEENDGKLREGLRNNFKRHLYIALELAGKNIKKGDDRFNVEFNRLMNQSSQEVNLKYSAEKVAEALKQNPNISRIDLGKSDSQITQEDVDEFKRSGVLPAKLPEDPEQRARAALILYASIQKESKPDLVEMDAFQEKAMLMRTEGLRNKLAMQGNRFFELTLPKIKANYNKGMGLQGKSILENFRVDPKEDVARQMVSASGRKNTSKASYEYEMLAINDIAKFLEIDLPEGQSLSSLEEHLRKQIEHMGNHDKKVDANLALSAYEKYKGVFDKYGLLLDIFSSLHYTMNLNSPASMVGRIDRKRFEGDKEKLELLNTLRLYSLKFKDKNIEELFRLMAFHDLKDLRSGEGFKVLVESKLEEDENKEIQECLEGIHHMNSYQITRKLFPDKIEDYIDFVDNSLSSDENRRQTHSAIEYSKFKSSLENSYYRDIQTLSTLSKILKSFEKDESGQLRYPELEIFNDSYKELAAFYQKVATNNFKINNEDTDFAHGILLKIAEGEISKDELSKIANENILPRDLTYSLGSIEGNEIKFLNLETHNNQFQIIGFNRLATLSEAASLQDLNKKVGDSGSGDFGNKDALFDRSDAIEDKRSNIKSKSELSKEEREAIWKERYQNPEMQLFFRKSHKELGIAEGLIICGIESRYASEKYRVDKYFLDDRVSFNDVQGDVYLTLNRELPKGILPLPCPPNCRPIAVRLGMELPNLAVKKMDGMNMWLIEASENIPAGLKIEFVRNDESNPDELSTLPPLERDSEKFLNRNNLKIEWQNLISTLESDTNLSDKEKHDIMATAWVSVFRYRDTFEYLKDFSNEVDQLTELVNVGKANCDGASKGVMALMREIGISSNQVITYSSSTNRFSNGDDLYEGNSHGIATSYIDGEWKFFDPQGGYVDGTQASPIDDEYVYLIRNLVNSYPVEDDEKSMQEEENEFQEKYEQETMKKDRLTELAESDEGKKLLKEIQNDILFEPTPALPLDEYEFEKAKEMSKVKTLPRQDLQNAQEFWFNPKGSSGAFHEIVEKTKRVIAKKENALSQALKSIAYDEDIDFNKIILELREDKGFDDPVESAITLNTVKILYRFNQDRVKSFIKFIDEINVSNNTNFYNIASRLKAILQEI